MTETLTPEQRTEVRRTLLQSIAEIQRGLTLAGMMLKKGMFGGARDTITGTEGLLIMHEALAQSLLKENQRLTEENKRLAALVLDIDSMLAERSVTLDGTWNRMLEEGMKPKSQRDPDHDHDATLRYGHYAVQARTIMQLVRNKIGGRG